MVTDHLDILPSGAQCALGSQGCDEVCQNLLPLRPRPVSGCGIDMACETDIPKFAPPSGGHICGLFESGIGIVLTGGHERREWQRKSGHRSETLQCRQKAW